MKIISLKGSMGRDLYGKLECEHCLTQAELRAGYDDHHWHTNVLPALHCGHCGKNRAGQFRSKELEAENKAKGVNGHGAPIVGTIAGGVLT